MIEIKKILIVVADASRAIFYIAHGPHNVVKLDELTDPEGRLEEHELTSKEHDINTCPYEMKNSKKEQNKEHFSKQVVAQANKILEAQHLNEVCLCAPPKFLGMMNKAHFKKHIKITELNKEYVHVNSSDILQLIKDAGLSFIPS